MTKLRAALTSDEKTILRHARTVGLTASIALLRRQAEGLAGEAAHPGPAADGRAASQGLHSGLEGRQDRALVPDAGQRQGYIVKA